MNRKIFISALGTSVYYPCKYQRDGFISKETRFIQEATLNYLHAKQWKPTDQIYILTTPKAKKSNWDAEITERFDFHNQKNIPYQGLEKILEEMHLPCPFTRLDLQEVTDKEQEMWNVFTLLYDQLQEGDELYLDLTHAFRYLPMLLLVFCNYTAYMKNTKIRSITYGNYEGSNTDEKNIEDLFPLSYLQEWTFAAATFKKFGRMIPLSESLKDGYEKWTRHEKKGTMKEYCSKILKNIQKLDQEINTCRGYELQSGITAFEIQDITQQALNSNNLPAPISKILSKIQNIINPFECNTDLEFDKTKKNLEHAINWCIRYQMIQQGYTLGQETIITLLYEELKDFNPYISNGNSTNPSKDFRTYLSSLIGIREDKLKDRTKWEGGIRRYPDLAIQIINQPWYNQIKPPYEKLTKYRNEINHGGFHRGAVTAKKLSQELESNIKQCMKILEEYHGNLLPEHPEKALREKILINLSNHPQEKWSDEQRQAATAYGKVVDYPFPTVPPEADEAAIRNMAKTLVSDIQDQYADKDLTIHIMGEMTLTCQAISLFRDYQIPCIASTTERIVTEGGNQERISTFRFCRFRKYN